MKLGNAVELVEKGVEETLTYYQIPSRHPARTYFRGTVT